MSVKNLHQLFAPKSVAVIGASDKPHSVGATVLRNLVHGGFAGTIFPVNPKHSTLEGLTVYKDVGALPTAPDLAVLCSPPHTIPGLIADLGAAGTRAAIVLTAGLSEQIDGISIKQSMLDAAKPHTLRILGPNCVGLLVPGCKLNASFAHTDALPGKIAFISQSGALVTGVLDWANTRGIGFSKFISLGDSADVDFGDLLDYLASDADTNAILMYIEDIHQARKFMSAARAAARSKPTIVIKAGRAPEGAKAAASHTGAMAGSDDVYDTAFRRAGMLRVLSTEELFDAVETLAHARPLQGERLTILTNGGGPGVMATDALIASGGKLANLSDDTKRKLNDLLPATWSHGNPVDIIGDAPAERYVHALDTLLQAPESDAILFIHAPTAIVPSQDIAQAIAPLLQSTSRTILACWLGGNGVAQARQIFADAGIPTFDTPEDAVEGFMQLVHYRRNQALLTQIPPSSNGDATPDREEARTIIREVLKSGRNNLSEPEAKAVFTAYDIPVVKTLVAKNVEQAVSHAIEIGFPIAVKILSPDINHKSDVGGVALDLESADAVRSAVESMSARIKQVLPNARLTGFSVQEMARRPNAMELIAGATTDQIFGPVIMFGQGGTSVEVTKDHALALPPLNAALAHDLISRTRVASLLAGYRNRPAANIDAVIKVLTGISQLLIDIPEINELDINPLLADEHGVVALDARIAVKSVAADIDRFSRLAIRPYPDELEERITWDNQSLVLRPIRPEDAAAHLDFFKALNPTDIRFRAFSLIRDLSPTQLVRATQIDYDREMAFIATRSKADGASETLGIVRGVTDADNQKTEFAVVVRSDLKGHGLGKLLMEKLIVYCRRRGTQEMIGDALSDNVRLLNMVKGLGFTIKSDFGDGTYQLHLDLPTMD